MERVLIGLLVLGFMLGTMYVAAWLSLRQPGVVGEDPELTATVPPASTNPESTEFVQLIDSAFTSALD